MVEIWDAYDSDFNLIENNTLVRGESIPDGMYHLVGEIVVKHKDGTYLLMQRDYKKHLGGMWELTAGGSALQGEASLECAVRELKEETGIESDTLQEIGRVVHNEHHALYVEYLCITDWNKNAVALQKGETVAYKWVSKNTLLEMGADVLASSRTIKLIKELNL